MAEEKTVEPETINCPVCIQRNSGFYFVDPGPCPQCGAPFGAVGKITTDAAVPYSICGELTPNVDLKDGRCPRCNHFEQLLNK